MNFSDPRNSLRDPLGQVSAYLKGSFIGLALIHSILNLGFFDYHLLQNLEFNKSWLSLSVSVSLLFLGAFFKTSSRAIKTFSSLTLISLCYFIYESGMNSPLYVFIYCLWLFYIACIIWDTFPLAVAKGSEAKINKNKSKYFVYGLCQSFVVIYIFRLLDQIQNGFGQVILLYTDYTICCLSILKYTYRYKKAVLKTFIVLIIATTVLTFFTDHMTFKFFLLLLPSLHFLIDEFAESELYKKLTEILLTHPERLFVATFLFLCSAGFLLFSLPYTTANDLSLSASDKIFTSVSAVCVTGLTILDPSTELTLFGQGILLLLIQLGGIGIMTFSALGLQILGARLSLKYEGTFANILSPQDRSKVFQSARMVILFTLVTELIGTVFLTTLFIIKGKSFGDSLWQGLFTSISAFCNAGFALNATSLMTYQNDSITLLVISILIILGGISPMVVFAVGGYFKNKARPIYAQTKIILFSVGFLTVIPFLLILIFEWSQSLSHLTWEYKVLNAFFQSVTLRTAGFNSIDISAISPASYIIFLACMFIGGSPGGTAGGIKNTTFAILLIASFYALKGQDRMHIFSKHISTKSIFRAVAIFIFALIFLCFVFILLQATQAISPRALLFETVSALGTVGLSMGVTDKLDIIGRIIIMVCMFLGRVGPLSFFMVLTQKYNKQLWHYPSEEIDVG